MADMFEELRAELKTFSEEHLPHIPNTYIGRQQAIQEANFILNKHNGSFYGLPHIICDERNNPQHIVDENRVRMEIILQIRMSVNKKIFYLGFTADELSCLL